MYFSIKELLSFGIIRKKLFRLWLCPFGFLKRFVGLQINKYILLCKRWLIITNMKTIQDSLFMLKQQQEDEPEKDITLCWSCPNCRTSYSPADIPRKYICYCGKQVDPKFDPWLNPHSCGERCGKALKPECKHKCVLLCHPGMKLFYRYELTIW